MNLIRTKWSARGELQTGATAEAAAASGWGRLAGAWEGRRKVGLGLGLGRGVGKRRAGWGQRGRRGGVKW
ncbi:hypothetical protein TIFTF001_041917 [Ficus carica]|uniref:Uncharacterized protein n=1 Tax=Ficus carica TaxID=3494 RepID=A0AA88CWW4_FICCA|nr:hypothetical protein TIFTF001_041917 [Ficus carica]